MNRKRDTYYFLEVYSTVIINRISEILFTETQLKKEFIAKHKQRKMFFSLYRHLLQIYNV